MSESVRRQICCLKEQLAALQAQVDALIEVDNQVIGLAGNVITLSGGLVPDTTVDLTPFLDNTDDQVISASLTGTDLVITLEDGGSVTVPLASINTDDQTLTLAGANLSIEDGNTIDLSAFLDNTDDQTITGFNLVGNTLILSIEDGNTVNVDLSQFQDNTDDQTLTLVGNNLSIEDGNTIDLSQFEETLSTTDVTRTVGFAEGFILDNGTNAYVFNATATRTAVGRYTVNFNTPHPAGVDYSIQLTLASDEPNRDQRKIAWTNKNAGFFQVVITADDNGGAADFFVDETFDFRVNVIETLVTSAVLT